MGNRRSVLLAAVLTTVCAVAAFLLVAGGNPQSSAQSPLTPATTSATDPVGSGARAGTARVADDAAPPEDLPSLGIQFHGTWSHYDKAKRGRVLDAIAASGATWVRLDVSWAMIQPTANGYDLGWGVPLVDEVMAQIEERGLKVVTMFWLTPDWASDGGGQYASPTDPQDYADALGWATRRWGDVVDAWEIWNEPNLESFYVGTDPAGYTDLLCAAYDAVHDNDESTQVVFGGLMYNDDVWLDAAYDAGAKGCFDVLAVHSYMVPANAPPGLSDDGEVYNLRHLDAVRATMVRRDDPRPIWITEFGWSIHENGPRTKNWRLGVTEEQQAQYAAQALKILGAEFPYVTNAFWYKDVVDDEGTDPHQEGFAMLDVDLQPRQVYRTFQQLYGVN